jgi:hypothetical protein
MMLVAIARLSAIGLLVSGLVWFSMVYGPRYASADVYLDLGPSNAPRASARGVPRPVIINNQTLILSHQQVGLPLEQALLTRPPVTPAKATGTESPDGGVFDSLAALKQGLELQGAGWKMQASLPGLLVHRGIYPITAGMPDATPTPVPGTVVLGMEDGRTSDLWTLDLPASFDFLELFGDGMGDAPGFDLPDISRYPGSHRELSMEIPGPTGPTRLLAFTVRGQLQDRKRYYRDALEAAGMRLERELVADDGAVVLDLEGKGKRYAVYLSVPEPSGSSTDIFQIQTSQSGR